MILLPLLITGLALIVTGVLLIHLPALRAQRAMRRGDIETACEIYRSQLEENPEKIKYYRLLGELYYQQQRTDAEAMRIYEIILRLNIPFRWREDILPWVAEHYLKEGRKDAEALALIETAVQTKLRKLNSSL